MTLQFVLTVACFLVLLGGEPRIHVGAFSNSPSFNSGVLSAAQNLFPKRHQNYQDSLTNNYVCTRHTPLRLSSSNDGDDEITKLRAAAAKAREEAEKLSQALGKAPAATASTAPKKSIEEIKEMLPAILDESDVVKQAEQWNELKSSKSVSGYGQAVLRSFPVSLQMLEQRTGLTPESLGLNTDGTGATGVELDDFKYATLFVLGFSSISGIASLALLPPNVGAAACYFFALFPILFLGIGSTAPQFIANIIAGLKGEGKDDETVSTNERICRHEAAHFCCGYWCGLPVSGYSVSPDDGIARVEFGVGGNQKYSETEVAALAVTALSGIVGEALEWNKAEGVAQDLMQLQQVFAKSSSFVGSAQQQDLTRWGAFTAANLLKSNSDKYEKVVEAFRRQAPVDECIVLLES